jgi:hypothetical protein
MYSFVLKYKDKQVLWNTSVYSLEDILDPLEKEVAIIFKIAFLETKLFSLKNDNGWRLV